MELAKGVSALANSDGGIILISVARRNIRRFMVTKYARSAASREKR
jgi:hypothetical protein